MSTRRFFCEEFVSGELAEIVGEEARHLSRVLRAEEGHEVELFDGLGHRAMATVKNISRSAVEVHVGELENRTGRGRVAVIANIAFPRGGAADDVMRRLIECGVSAIREISASRSVRKPSKRTPAEQQERFSRLALSAMKQCGLNLMPRLLPALPLSDLQIEEGVGAVFGSTQANAARVYDKAREFSASTEKVEFVVGPEGGLTEVEESQLREAGFAPVSLGPTILRVETAAIAMASFLGSLR